MPGPVREEGEGSPSLDALFSPRAVAMVGATAGEHKIGGRRWKSLVNGGFSGALFPVHPSAAEVLGYKAYPSLRDLPGPADLAIVVVPTGAVLEVAHDCVASGVRAVVVISAGFAESGEEGARLETELAHVLRVAGIPMIGPNSAGIASTPAGINVTGWPAPPGPVGLISQSGNISLQLGYLTKTHGGGFSRIITIGNARDLGVAALTAYLLEDSHTEVVLLYIEGWRDGEGLAFLDAVRSSRTRKPVILCNPGRTETGRRAALSHTGALAAPRRVVEGACRQAGILLVDDVEESWLLANALSTGRAPGSSNVCVLTDGGGHATLVCDALDAEGMQARPLRPATQRDLAALLPPRCGIANPVDFAGVAETEPRALAPVLEICLADPEVGAVVLAGHFGGYHRIGGARLEADEFATAESFRDSVLRHRKPFLVHSVYGNEALPAFGPLRAAGIPVTPSVRGIARLARGLWQARSSAPPGRGHEPAGAPIDEARARRALAAAADGPPQWLMEPEARELLEAGGIAFPAYLVADSEDGCAAAIAELGVPVALKLIAPGVVHKSDSGGVRLGISGPDAGREAFRSFSTRQAGEPFRVLVTPMIAAGVEALFGAVRDPQFGPCVMFGLGGTLVELLDDVTLRPAPISPDEAHEMLAEVRLSALMDGARGAEPIDRGAAAGLLARLSEVMAAQPEIAEIDLNPVFLRRDGLALADARVVLCDPSLA